MPNYLLYDISQAALRPWRAMAEAAKLCFDNPFNPVAHTAFGRNMTATYELFERTTRRYDKPTFGRGQEATRVQWSLKALAPSSRQLLGEGPVWALSCGDPDSQDASGSAQMKQPLTRGRTMAAA